MTVLTETSEAPGSGSEDRCRDTAWMRQFYQGSEQAFEELASCWRPQLHTFFQRMQFTPEDAADLTQETLLQLYLGRERLVFDLERPLAPYLLRIARNFGLDLLRRRKQRPVAPLEEQVHVPETGPIPDRVLTDLMACVLALPEPQMLYIFLCDHHGMGDHSHGEIATILGKWPSQVTGISKDAQRNLRRCLEKKGYSVEPPEVAKEL